MEEILKKGRTLIGLLLILSLIFSNMSVFAYGQTNSEELIEVYFEKESGEKVVPDEKGQFTLTSLDKGRFKLNSEKEIKAPYWDCKVPMQEGNKQWTDIWITAGGIYQGGTERTVFAKVYDKDKMYLDAKLLKEFSIKNVKADIEELKVYVDGQEVNKTKPAILQVKGNIAGKPVVVKAKVKGKPDFIDVPVTAYQLEALDKNNGWTQSNGYFGFRDEAKSDEVNFKITMKDGSAETIFKAVKENIKAKDFVVNIPEIAYITDWNQLNGKQYIGITEDKLGDYPDRCYSIDFLPEETSNRAVIWESLTPEIAEFQPLYGNGIVPKKAGTALFRITSESNPELKKEIRITFKYQKPLKAMSIEKNKFILNKFESIELPMKALPTDATEQRYKWSFDKPGIVKIEENVSRKNLHVSHTTTHTMEALKEGTVKVTGIPFDSTGGAKPISFDVEVVANSTSQNINYSEMAKEGINHGTDVLEKGKNDQYNSEWQLFTLARSGLSISEEDIAKYRESVVENMDAADDYWPATDYERVIIALTSLGEDATDMEGYDLIDTLCNLETIESSTSNAIIYGLLALDTKPYQTYDDMQWNRDKLIERLLTFQNENGGFKLNSDSNVSDTDITAMALQALAPYYQTENSNRKNDEIQSIEKENYKKVQVSVNKALKYLSEKMDSKAGYKGNSCTASQVMTALTSLNIDPIKDERFTKGDKNLITNLMSFKNDNGFAKDDKSDIANNFSNTQVTYALVSYIRMMEGETSLYDMSDVIFDQEGESGNEDTFVDYDELVLDMLNKLYPLVYCDLPKEKEKIEQARKEFDELYNKLNSKEESKSFATELKQREYILNGLEGIITITTYVNLEDYYEKEQKQIKAIWDEYVPKLRDIAEIGEQDETALSLVKRAVSSLKTIKTKEKVDRIDEEKKEKIKKVEEKISKINLSSGTAKEDILQARKQYQKLSFEDRKNVKNIDVLVEAEKSIVSNLHPAGYIYLAIEKSTLGQGYFMKPCKIPYYEGESLADVMNRNFNINRIEYDLGNYDEYYLAGIYESVQKKVELPVYVKNYIENNNILINYERNSLRLGERDYTTSSGWVFKVNNEHSPVGASNVFLTDGMTIRWAYTVVGMGNDCWDTPNSQSIVPYVLNKDNLIKSIAEFNQREDKEELLKDKKIKEAYDTLLNLGTNNEITQEHMDQSITTLNLLVKEKTENDLLAEMKNKAIKELESYKDNEKYGEENTKLIIEIKKQGKVELQNAKSVADVEKILTDVKAKLDNIKTDSQLKEEEKSEGTSENENLNIPQTEVKKPEIKKKDMINTGDKENILTEVILMLLATGTIVTVRRKKNKFMSK